jgi:hypothetical protein
VFQRVHTSAPWSRAAGWNQSGAGGENSNPCSWFVCACVLVSVCVYSIKVIYTCLRAGVCE